jgi:hypothetical protein
MPCLFASCARRQTDLQLGRVLRSFASLRMTGWGRWGGIGTFVQAGAYLFLLFSKRE